MNKVVLAGRLTRDPDIRYASKPPADGQQPMMIARYTLAVDRLRVSEDSDQTADFIDCVVFGSRAAFVQKYLRKGMKMLISGRIHTGSFISQEGKKIYTVEVDVDEHEFCEKKAIDPDAPQSDDLPEPSGPPEPDVVPESDDLPESDSELPM